jgi:hypothetical protein
VTVLDADTGANIGSPVSFNGLVVSEAQITPDGSRAIFFAYQPDTSGTSSTGIGGTSTVVINTATGARVGNVVTLAGMPAWDPSDPSAVPTLPQLSPDGSRVVVTTYTSDSTSGSTAHVAIINTSTGLQVGNTIVLAGGGDNEYESLLFTGAGNRALILTYAGNSDTGYTTRYALVDTATGAQLGATRTFTSSWQPSYVVLSGDDTRVTVFADTDAATNVSSFDVATGAQVGSTRSYTGTGWSWYADDDPARAVITTTNGTSTNVTVLDTKTMTEIKTIGLSGNRFVSLLSADASRAFVTSTTGTSTTVTVLQISQSGTTSV